MDRYERTANVLKAISRFRRNQLKDHELIPMVCDYFDKIRREPITQNDLKFLKYIANFVGIPHFYDLLSNFDHNIEIQGFDLNTLASSIYESSLHINEVSKVHKYQKLVLDSFTKDRVNRFFLSASTSFGKTHLVYEIIRKMGYRNVVLIFPTVALLTENLEKILSGTNYEHLRDNYKIHTLSEVAEIGDRNIFIYTPERFLSFLETNKSDVQTDFVFIDEVYKIDNDYELDEETRENERDVAYRLATHYAIRDNCDNLFAGPYIDFSSQENLNYNPSFENFLRSRNIQLIDYNNYDIVNKHYYNIKSKQDNAVDDDLSFVFRSKNKDRMLTDIINGILNIGETCIIYCPQKIQVERYGKKLAQSLTNQNDYSSYQDFIDHISQKFDSKWVVITALKSGIGLHHGLIPKYIQKEIVSLFNDGLLKVLISTTTITEGVNTSAKNLVVLDSYKGNKRLKKFDAKNIAGRAGRFLHHYSGRVFVLQNDFMEIINSDSDGIKHKNFDIDSPKDEIDLFYSDSEYLSESDLNRLSCVLNEQASRNIPDHILDQYKVVSRIDKIKVYDEITKLSDQELLQINTLISRLNYSVGINFDGFQAILKAISPIVKNKNLYFLITNTHDSGYSSLTFLIYYYLRDGFKGSMEYNKKGRSIDSAIRKTSEFVYNLLRYQVVKYLGVFNIMYKFHQSNASGKSMESVGGIDRLLTKLEYNALTYEGRVASDFGVPASIVTYYDYSPEIRSNFDSYESKIFERFNTLVNKTSR